MGDIIPFRVPARRPVRAATEDEIAVIVAVERDGDCRAVLEAAGPLLQRLSVAYGFTVMRDGLPDDPGALANALLLVSRALGVLAAEIDLQPSFGGHGIYFGRTHLAWLDTGGAASALAIPPGTGLDELVACIHGRLAATPPGRRARPHAAATWPTCSPI